MPSQQNAFSPLIGEAFSPSEKQVQLQAQALNEAAIGALPGDPASVLNNKRPTSSPKPAEDAEPAAGAPKPKRQKKPPTAEQIAKKEAKAAEKAAQKEAARAAKAAEREERRLAKEEEKEESRRLRALHKEMGDEIKSRLHIVKRRGEWYVPDGSVAFFQFGKEEFDFIFGSVRGKFEPNPITEKTRVVVGDLDQNECEAVFGKTKLKGGSMYAQFCVKEMTVTWRVQDQKLTVNYSMGESCSIM
mmetsp:Transcript_22679/g.57460  ORF Transcript_22679/g.57460 Transcript_22679/m.57460 type:complete len:245 (-) Transcript_22679:512-1246(-)|eukprot:CAMPEP_0178994896 /NCGR_PEP_ID=MMETSP0795-20121207/7542_1 /TAXON_ID=88552 /ORGANISM="Amoebophrya sp., Strain Ameob2" /LENGTH=244 /DNA_ID=CAMNT_0020687175 /DNA_START=82 /DNA_END=816 /DNA_ORIENTATION=-